MASDEVIVGNMAGNEVMVGQNQGLGQKITQVAILLSTQKEVKISAINLAIPAAINLAELIKHKVKGLHQINFFERMQDSKKTRISITLSLNPLDSNHKGYQPPIPEDQVEEKSLEELKKPPQRQWKKNPDEFYDKNSRRSPRRRAGRARFQDNENKRNLEATETNQDYESSRNRRPRRVRRANAPRRGGFGSENHQNYEERNFGDSENTFGRSSRGQRSRRPARRPRKQAEGSSREVPVWGSD